MVDSALSELLPIAEAFRRATGQTVSTTTLWRYCSHGRNGHRLRNWLVGTARLTTIASVLEFCEAAGSGSPRPAANRVQD
jgi:hypothetical protein